MDLSEYQELTGTTVPNSKTGFYTAQLNRATRMLETMLGFSLNPDDTNSNLYNELGKTQQECFCPSVGTEDLLPAEAPVNSYRLFRYEDTDEFLHVDPFTKVHSVRLAFMRPGDDGFVSIRQLYPKYYRVNMDNTGIGKYIQRGWDYACACRDRQYVMVAIDADWVWTEEQGLPDDLKYVLADMVTWYSDPKANIKSESITTHSYTKFDNTPPEQLPTNLAVIKKYAGPNGSVTVRPTW